MSRDERPGPATRRIRPMTPVTLPYLGCDRLATAVAMFDNTSGILSSLFSPSRLFRLHVPFPVASPHCRAGGYCYML